MQSSKRFRARLKPSWRLRVAGLGGVHRRPGPPGWWRYGAATAAVVAAFLVRAAAAERFGPELPPYLTFYPAAMLVAMLAGPGPGLLAPLLSGLAAACWVLPSEGRFVLASPTDRAGLVIYIGRSLCLSWVAGLYRNARDKAAAYDQARVLRRSQWQLRELSQRLAYHVDHSPLAVIEWDQDMRLIRWSGGAERIFGWKAQEVLGKRMGDFRWVCPEDQPQPARLSDEVQTGPNPRWFSTKRNYRKDGSIVHCEWYNSSLADPSGQLRSILSLVLDVTERKRMETTLQEEARRKDEFLALLGHELRNPLAPIGNAVHLLSQNRLSPELSERACAILQRQVAHLARLVDDLLDISRISRGRIELKAEPLDLRETVQTVIADYRPVLDQHGLALETRYGPEVPVRADRARIVQAMSNLLHNAIKFTDPGGRVVVAVGREPGWGYVRVEDTGLGIRADRLGTLFDPFRQGPETIGRSRGGLGLGLALVKGLVALHGGAVSAESAGLGQGSRFTLRLPLASESSPQDLRTPAQEPPGRQGDRSIRILIVEDMADSAVTLQLLLRMQGHTVEIAADGQTGLDLAQRFQPEIVLCDIGLPGALSGHDVARIIRTLPGLEGVQLIALSGFGTPEDKRRAAEAGFDTHLTKPVDPTALEALLQTVGPRRDEALRP